jgi:hypothetical protein
MKSLESRVKTNKIVEEVKNLFIGELNNEETRGRIAYIIKTNLEKEGVDFETINTYSNNKSLAKGEVDIEIDGKKYPLPIIIETVERNNWNSYLEYFEIGNLQENDITNLFQYLINEGVVWNLKSDYRRIAEDLIENGKCTLSNKETVGSFLWGNPKLPSKFDLQKGAVGTDEYVKKFKKLL